MDTYRKIKEYFLRKENRFKLASLLVLLVTMPAAILLVQQTIRFFSGAADSQANLYILPSTADVSGAQTFQVMLDPMGNPIAFAALDITFDITKVRLTQDPVLSGVLGNTMFPLTNANTANTTGVISIVLGLGFDQKDTPPTQPFELVQLTFEPIEGVGENIEALLGITNVDIVDINTVESLVTEVAGSTLTLNPVASPSPTPESGNVNLAFANIPASIVQDDNFNFTVDINTNGFSVVGTDLILNFDPSIIRIDSAAVGMFNKTVNEVIDNTNGLYSISLLADTDIEPIVGTGSILTLSAKAIASGSSEISIDPETVVAGTGTAGQNLIVVTSPTTLSVAAATPTSSPTATPTGTPDGSATPSASPVAYANEDINEDGTVSILDYVILFQFYGDVSPTNARADINRDGRVNVKDYALLYQAFE